MLEDIIDFATMLIEAEINRKFNIAKINRGIENEH